MITLLADTLLRRDIVLSDIHLLFREIIKHNACHVSLFCLYFSQVPSNRCNICLECNIRRTYNNTCFFFNQNQ